MITQIDMKFYHDVTAIRNSLEKQNELLEQLVQEIKENNKNK